MTVLLALPLTLLKAAATLMMDAIDMDQKVLTRRAQAEYLVTMGR